MEITPEQYEKIKDSLPLQRGNVRLTNLQILNAILYVAEQGCNRAGFPAVWQLAYDLRTDESLGEERRA